MSWVIGYIDVDPRPDLGEIGSKHGLSPLHRWRGSRSAFVAGGIPETCTFERQADPDSRDERAVLTLGYADDPDGPHVSIELSGGVARFTNDPLALRTLHLRRWRGGIAFSTRLDLLTALCGPTTVHLGVLGAQWLTHNRWTPAPLVTDTTSLGQGGEIIYQQGELKVRERPWRPSTTEPAPLDEIVFRYASDPRASLGLSGGLDSRAVLAVLLARGVDPTIHVFGDESDVDVRLSRRIARRLGLRNRLLKHEMPPVDECIRLLERHAAEACVIVPASQSIKVEPYRALYEDQHIVVDGGFGEIARRQFLNRLLLRSPDSLTRRDARSVLPFVSFRRGAPFAADVEEEMSRLIVVQVQSALDRLPDDPRFSNEDLADLLAIQTRLPWYFGIEQARMDAIVPSCMPFATPAALEAVMQMPVRLRRRGRFFRRMIREGNSTLAGIPLAKGNAQVPFNAPHEVAAAVVHLRARFGRGSGTSPRDEYLTHLKPYILDTLDSIRFRSCPLYDHQRIRDIASRYFAGEKSLAGELDWWLALDAWLRSVS